MTSADNDIQEEITALRRRRDELRERLAQIEKDYQHGLSADSDEQAIELENAEVLSGIASATAEELASVEARLAELE